jgi:hypothetical protein
VNGLAKAARPAAGYALAGVLLFCVYLRLSGTQAENSDMANILLMASGLGHGNLLLSGWHMSDVSFYTTELPQYALLEFFLGVRMATAHVAAAMTYTLTVLLAVVLATGGRSGREAVVRALIAGGILLAPQPGGGVYALDLAVGHIGTSVPLLLTWLLLDRARPGWRVPVLAAVLLAWVLAADPVVELAGLAPLAVVCVIRITRGLARGELGWYEPALAAAAGAAAVMAWSAGRLLRALGGYVVNPVPFQLRTLRELRGSVQGIYQVLELFGADPAGLHGIQAALAVLHLASVVLAGAAVLRAGRRFFRVTLADQVLAVAVVLLVLVYLGTTASEQGAHEIAMAAPFAAALTARMLAAPALALAARAPRALVPGVMAAVLVLGGYLAGLGYGITRPCPPPEDSALASWLVAHHLRYGLADYWQSSSVTVDSGGRAEVRAVAMATLTPYLWMSDEAWYNPALHQASFLILNGSPDSVPRLIRTKFGAPSQIYHVGQYTVLVWHRNLLRSL